MWIVITELCQIKRYWAVEGGARLSVRVICPDEDDENEPAPQKVEIQEKLNAQALSKS